MKQNTKAKYFCENCGNEVAANARFCPHCGRFFSAVRCPKCSYAGSVTSFKHGCPRCHYAMTHEDIYGPDTPRTAEPPKKNHFFIRNPGKKKPAQRSGFTSDAPAWLYVASIIVLICIIGIIFFRCSQ